VKGRISIKGPTDFFRGDEIDIPSGEPLKEISLTGEKGGERLKARVRCQGGSLDCLVGPENNPDMIAFWFLNIPGPGQVFKRRGQTFSTGKFVPWICHFERTKD